MAVISDSLSTKYVVTTLDGKELEDGVECFVVRAQDVFGAQALYAYANAIQGAIEIDALTDGGLLSSDQVESLRELSFKVHELAVGWSRRLSKKVPD